MNLKTFIQGQISDLGHQLSGIGHLLQHYDTSEGYGDKDDERMRGVGDLIVHLSERQARLAQLLEVSNSEHLESVEVKTTRYDYDEVGTAYAAISAARDARKGSV